MIEVRPVSTPDYVLGHDRSAYIGFDTEGALITETTPVPRLCCLTYYVEGRSYIVGYRQAGDAFKEMMRYALQRRHVMVAHHLTHDTMSLLLNDTSIEDLLIECYDHGLFEDTLLNEKLDDIARGEYDNKKKARWGTDPTTGKRRMFYYGLGDSVMRRIGRVVAKGEDTWRKRYDELRDVPLDQWPRDALDYALDDATWVTALRTKQDEDEAASPAHGQVYVYTDAAAQARAGFGLALCRWLGVPTDPVMTLHVKDKLSKRQAAVIERLYETGFVKKPFWMPKAKRWAPASTNETLIKTKLLEAARLKNIDVKVTPKAQKENEEVYVSPFDPRLTLAEISIDKEARQRVDDPDINKYGEYQSVSKLLTYTKILETGFTHPIHSEPNTLVANGRISWGSDSPDGVGDDAKSVNLTNLPKEPGIRECYIAPPDHYMWTIDFSQLELCTVAQACLDLLGYSQIADLINQGEDLHTRLALLFLRPKGINLSTDEFKRLLKSDDVVYNGLTADDLRNASKRTNFGFLGGMGVDKFMQQNRDLKLPRADVEGFKKTFMTGYAEMKDFFKIADQISNGSAQLVQLTSYRIRGGLGYCDAANTWFSGLAADGVKDALYRVQREFFFDKTSVLYGNGGVFADIHDELAGFARRRVAHEVVERVDEIMRFCMQERTSQVKIKTSKALSLRWRKGAKEYRDATGRMQPFEFSPDFRKLVNENTPEKIKMVDEPLLYDGTYPGYV